jgi:hypothetical protein
LKEKFKPNYLKSSFTGLDGADGLVKTSTTWYRIHTATTLCKSFAISKGTIFTNESRKVLLQTFLSPYDERNRKEV